MHISCPHCQAKLKVGTPKPGRYKPKCKECGEPFLLQVQEGDPPRFATARIKQPAGSPDLKTNPTDLNPDEPTASKSDSDVEATIDAVDRTTREVPSSDPEPRKPDSPSGDSQSRTMVDETIDSTTVASKTDVATDATMDSVAPIGASSGTNLQSESSKGSVVRSGTGRGIPVDSNDSEIAPHDSAGQVSQLPERLGGYRIQRILGQGAMGAVYEAKQLSLDRTVALKTIRGKLVDNPASLARFTREAYAAAQLTHHNVVQIYDFGEDGGRHYFSMEWVRGGTLRDLVKSRGALEPKLAVGYTLQAARGLQFAHRNGMVHRDVKPANLLINEDGIVKVADLGLVKIPDLMDPEPEPAGIASVSGVQSGTHVTMQGTAVGTPAYMAPEQSLDAANVDHRADVYSLGCSLFFMLAGQAPFDGSVVSEVLDQHAHQPVPELKQYNQRIPDSLQSIIQRSMAKRPDQRYESLGDMIRDLERHLGVDSGGSFSPSTQQADEWEAISRKFAKAAPLESIRPVLILGLIGLSTLLTLVMPFVGIHWLLFGPSLLVAAFVSAIVLGGSTGAVATVTRRWLSSLSWLDYAIGVVGSLVFLLVVFAAGLTSGFFLGSLIGVACGAGYHFGLIASIRAQRRSVLESAEKYIRNLRIDGADEDGIRAFVARYSGKKWQSIFEALFCYDALVVQRERLKTDRSFTGSTRENSRDRYCSMLQRKVDANRKARDHKQLAKVEERGLASEGLSASEAKDRAWQMASAILQNVQVPSQESLDAKAAAEAKRARFHAMMADARSGKYKTKRDPLAKIKFAISGQTRLLAGCLLLASFAIWAQNTGFADTVSNLANQDTFDVQDAANQVKKAGDDSESLLGTNGLSVGMAGLLLCMSAFVSGWRMTPFATIATLVILFGAGMGIPTLGPLPSWLIATFVGLMVYVPGIIWGEENEHD